MLKLDYELKFKKNRSYLGEDLGDDCTMLYCQEKESTFLLDGLMTFIYNICEEKNINEIVDRVINNFDVSEIGENEIKSDCEEAITQLMAEGVVIYE